LCLSRWQVIAKPNPELAPVTTNTCIKREHFQLDLNNQARPDSVGLAYPYPGQRLPLETDTWSAIS
jgi:hypothetical protein